MSHEQIQNLLAFLGYYKAGVDGIWGPASRKALTEFQRSAGLSATGEADETTCAALLKAVASWEPEKAGEPTGTFWDEIEYFTRDESGIFCPCGKCGGYPAEPRERLMRNADATRKHFGRPMIPSSTVRCAAHNASLKGSAPNSLHLTGRAMDFAIPGVSAAELEAYVRTLPEVHECYKIDGSYVHMGVQKY